MHFARDDLEVDSAERTHASQRPNRWPGCQLIAPVVPSCVAEIVTTPSATVIASGVRIPCFAWPGSGP